MATINLAFNHPINSSVQVGDEVFSCETTFNDLGTDFNTSSSSNTSYLGKVKSLNNPNGPDNISIDVENSIVPPAWNKISSSSFIMFSKSTVVNTSGITGYYADVMLKNNSDKKVELFSVGSQIFESSK